MKKFLSKLSVFILLLAMTLGFGTKTAFAYEESDLIQITDYYFEIWNMTDFSEYMDESLDASILEQYTRWQDLKNEAGEYVESVDTKVAEVDETVVVTKTEKYASSNIEFTITFDKTAVEIDPSSAIIAIDAVRPAVNSSGTATMAKAGMNTMMGMGVVFVVLIFISLVISLLKFVPALVTRKEKAEEPVEQKIAASMPSVSTNISTGTDDTELVAVITAAIAAFRAKELSGAQDSGFVVRSIRRRNK
ncbi:MAG: OadG family protein [Acetatifactor sp.]|nr:OadG family protein [Acetatifactor sp.]